MDAGERLRLDAAILDAVAKLGWATADRIAHEGGRSRTVDGRVVGARLRSLRHRGKVGSRPGSGSVVFWRRVD